MMYTLRFDVETLIIATWIPYGASPSRLRFDVETLIIATVRLSSVLSVQLRFDVETLIIATIIVTLPSMMCCGLM